jgi:hypothetical protein
MVSILQRKEGGTSLDEPEATSAYFCKYFGMNSVDAKKVVSNMQLAISA